MLLSHVQKQGWIFNPDNNNDTIAVQACDAWDRIQAHITGTPITTVSLANHNTTLHIKREDLQVTGSFKIYVPATTVGAKLEKLQAGGADVVIHGSDCIQAETAAREAAQVKNMPYISPYNDPLVVAGQGTIGLELLGALPPAALKTVFVPVGGGGLIAGIAAVLKAAHPVPHSRWEEQASAHGPVHGGEPTPTGADQNALPVDHALPVDQEDRGGAAIRVIGCQPAASDVMRRSVACGGVVEEVADDEDGMTTLSDGTAGGVEPHTCTLQPCMDYVDDWVTVTEQEIAAAIVELHTQCNIHCEGAAAMTYACVQKYIQGHAHVGRAGGLVMVCCGGNAQGELLDRAQEVLLSNA